MRCLSVVEREIDDPEHQTLLQGARSRPVEDKTEASAPGRDSPPQNATLARLHYFFGVVPGLAGPGLVGGLAVGLGDLGG